VKEQMADPAFQDSIREASMAACAQLPEGMMQDTCNMFVEQYGETQKQMAGNRLHSCSVTLMVACASAVVSNFTVAGVRIMASWFEVLWCLRGVAVCLQR
jgi:hypothetical protein